MTVELRILLSKENAERLLKSFQDGNLESLGITGLRIASRDDACPDNSVASSVHSDANNRVKE